MWWLLGGFLAMFFIERFFCYHHHDVPDDDRRRMPTITPAATIDHARRARAHHDLTWSGAALGLFLHSLLNGVALAASVPTATATRGWPASARFS